MLSLGDARADWGSHNAPNVCAATPAVALTGVESALGNGMLFLRDGAPGQSKRRHAVQAASWGVHTDIGEAARCGTSLRYMRGSELLSAPAYVLAGVESELGNNMLFLRDGAPGQFKRRHAVQAASIGVQTDIGEPAGGTAQGDGSGQ